MAKTVARNLSNDLEVQSKLPEMLGRDTVTTASVLTYDIYEGFQGKAEMVVAAIDLEDTYNQICYNRLIHLLIE